MVLIGTIVSAASGIIIDGYCGVLVGMFILYSGFVAAKDTISPLLGQPPEPELVQQINDIVLSYDDVTGIHDLIVHNYGPGRTLISLHAEVPADGNILTLHDTIDTIEHELRSIFDIVVPYDYPVSDQDVVDSVTKRIQMNHPDFYAVIDVDKAVVQ